MSAKKLSKGEKKVISAWNGSPKSTAKKCGLSHIYVRQLSRLPYILEHITKRDEEEMKKQIIPLIADRQERQEFWTSVLRGDPHVVKIVEKLGEDGKPEIGEDGKPVMVKIMGIPSIKDRERASELLGRSSADFVDRLRVSEESGVPQEITDDMDPKKATNTYLDLVKSRTAGND